METAIRKLPAIDARPLRIRPLAVSAAARAALLGGDAVVRAQHRLGASLALPGADDTVFMSRPGIGLFPAHIVIRARDLERVLNALETEGCEATDSGGAWSLRLDIRDVRIFHLRLAPKPAEMRSNRARNNIAAAGQWLRAHPAPLGLGAPAAELLVPGGRWLERLAALQGDTPPTESVLRALVGCGAGTTPAGDDVLVGALAYAWATQGENAPLVAAMRLLRAELPALTTAVGGTYLRAAMRGEFGSHLVAWVRALPRVTPQRSLALARRVAAHGASSGYDTLAGFVAAAALGRRRKRAETGNRGAPVSAMQALG